MIDNDDARSGFGHGGAVAAPLTFSDGGLPRAVAVLRRRVGLFGLLAALVMLMAVGVTLATPSLYTATTTVALNTRTERVMEGQSVLSGLPLGAGVADASLVDTEVEVLKSRRLTQQVVEALQLEMDPEFNRALAPASVMSGLRDSITHRSDGGAPGVAVHDRVVARVEGRLHVRRVGLTFVMEVQFASSDPVKAARIANAFVEHYLASQRSDRTAATRKAEDWLATQHANLTAEVMHTEAAVEQYRADNNLLSASGATLTEQEISSLNQQLATARGQQAEEEARLRTARGQRTGGASGEDVGEALGSPVVQALRTRRAEISSRVAELSSRYGPLHPEMIRAQKSLTDVDGEIQAEINRITANLEARVQVARERTASTVASLDRARATLSDNNAAAVRLRELQTEAEGARGQQQAVLDRLRQVRSPQATDLSDARVVSPASPPARRSSPDVLLNMGVGLVLAMATGLVGVVTADRLDQRLDTGRDVERRLGILHLGSTLQLASVADLVDQGMSPPDHVLKRPHSRFAESLRSLKGAIVGAQPGRPPKIIAFTSAGPGEGKTATALSVARVAAQGGAQVVMVECDLRRLGVGRQISNGGFEVAATRVDRRGSTQGLGGLCEAMESGSNLEFILRNDATSGLWRLSGEVGGYVANEALASVAMGDLLQRLGERFDLVIIDAPPVLSVAQSASLAAMAEAVVMLVQWRRTPDQLAASALRRLTEQGAPVVGAVLTQVGIAERYKSGAHDRAYYSYYGG